MLLSLNVQNFAIIEDLQVTFSNGMTVLTGETGAGKSLIIDTISLLLGQRADSDMIRYGEKKASIQGVFSYCNPKLAELLDRFEIPKEENLTILREIFDTSKNNIRLNGVPITLTMLKQIAVLLADIHIQNDTYRLFQPESYLEMITPKDDSKYDALFSKYTIHYSKYIESIKKYEYVVKGQKESQARIEYLEYEKSELASLHLVEGIDEALTQSVAKLENFDRIFSALNNAYENLSNDYFSIDQIHTAATELGKIASLDQQLQENSEKLLDCYYIVDEIKSDIYRQIHNMDFDEEELNHQLSLLNEIERVKSKYKMSVSELMSYYDKICLEIDMVHNYDALLKECRTAVEVQFEQVKASALKLSEYRKNFAKKMEKGIIKECLDLDLEDTKFEIQFTVASLEDDMNAQAFTETGIDKIDLLISFNKGEPLKPLYKVASGGEMSRIMLAFKSYFAESSQLSLMVFDEIDTGVSGATAKKIAQKLLSISRHTQLLCITHLPQVAAIGDHHIHIYKELHQQRTTTQIKNLSFEDRIEEVAMMLSGDKLSMYALEHAKALLNEKKS